MWPAVLVKTVSAADTEAKRVSWASIPGKPFARPGPAQGLVGALCVDPRSAGHDHLGAHHVDRRVELVAVSEVVPSRWSRIPRRRGAGAPRRGAARAPWRAGRRGGPRSWWLTSTSTTSTVRWWWRRPPPRTWRCSSASTGAPVSYTVARGRRRRPPPRPAFVCVCCSRT